MPIISQADATTEVGYPGSSGRSSSTLPRVPCRYTSATWKSDLEVGSPPTSTPTAKRPWSSWRAVWKQFWVTR